MSATFDLVVHAHTAAPWEPHETILRTYTVTVPGERRYSWGAQAIAPEDMDAAVALARKAAGESIPGSYDPMSAPCFLVDSSIAAIATAGTWEIEIKAKGA